MIEEVKKILRKNLSEYEKEIKKTNESPTGGWLGLDTIDEKVAHQICQLFPKSTDNPGGYEPKTKQELVEFTSRTDAEEDDDRRDDE